MKPCPISLKVMCIIGICWAALGLLGGLAGMALYFVTLGPPNPAMEAMKKEIWYITMVFGIGGICLLLSGLLLAGSIQGLKVQKSGQRMLTVYAWADAIMVIVSLVMNILLVFPRTIEAARPAAGPVPPGFEAAMHVGMYIGACGGLAFGLAMPVYVLITLRLKRVRDAFDGMYQPEGGFDMDAPPSQF